MRVSALQGLLLALLLRFLVKTGRSLAEFQFWLLSRRGPGLGLGDQALLNLHSPQSDYLVF